MKNFIFLMLLSCSTASACESYEDCIQWKTLRNGLPGGGKTTAEGTLYAPSEYEVLKAIAYKLDEISRQKKNDATKEWMLLNKQIDLLDEISRKLDMSNGVDTTPAFIPKNKTKSCEVCGLSCMENGDGCCSGDSAWKKRYSKNILTGE